MTRFMHLLSFRLAAGLPAIALLAAPAVATAQQIAGEYQVEVRGSTVYLDRKPVERPIRDNTVLTVEQDGDVIAITFNSFASAMSTTTFRGRVGNGRFVAIWSPEGTGSQAMLITGAVDGNRLRGRLIYPRATADASVPGWTEVQFSAVGHESRSSSSSLGDPGARPALPANRQAPQLADRLRPRGALETGSGNATNDEEKFAVDVQAITNPELPRSGRRITFLARGTPKQQGETVKHMELWINGLVQGSTDGNLLRVEAGPFDAGRLEYDIAAVSTDGRRSEYMRHTVEIIPPGNSIVYGHITGDVNAVDFVALVRRSDEKELARQKPLGNGQYQFDQVPAGDYVLFVSDGKREAMVSPSSNVDLHVDGSRRSYEQDFTVR
ncbi:MAG: hypothetical protein PVF05_09720 [Gemmatimonadales bacterium]|jgi:hypothetical protein